MNYDKSEAIRLLDAETISALLRIYNLKYKHLAVRFNCTKENIVYLIKHDRFKDYQREIILELFMQHGLDLTQLTLIHIMANQSKKKGGTS
jgi:hypothetical protein